MKNEDVCYHFGKKLKTACGTYEKPIEIPIIRKNQFRALRSLKLAKKVSLGNFARIARLCLGFHLRTLHGHCFH